MKLYRDLQPNETLQAGDEKQQWPLEWAPVDPAFYGANPGAYRLEYRRPVDLPVLQRVTPEAIRELEQSEWVGIIHTCEYYTAVKGWYGKQWYDEDTGNNVDRPTGGWFIELAKLTEVQQ
jgi:hypothetical protein